MLHRLRLAATLERCCTRGAIMEPRPGFAPEPSVNILLVDDRPEDLLALEAILGDLGQNLIKAETGEETLLLTQRQEFAVVLLDVQLYGLDGFETAKRIRSQERSRHTPIIFITGYDTSDFPIVEAYKLGAVDYLVKPLIPEILRAKVACFVDLFQQREFARH